MVTTVITWIRASTTTTSVKAFSVATMTAIPVTIATVTETTTATTASLPRYSPLWSGCNYSIEISAPSRKTKRPACRAFSYPPNASAVGWHGFQSDD